MHDTLKRLFRYKAWANNALLTTLAELDSESLVTKLAIKALSHSYIVDRIFAAHLRRKAHGYTSVNATELPTLKDLSMDIRKSDCEYIDYVSTLDRDQLAERTDFMYIWEYTDDAAAPKHGELTEQIDFMFTDGTLGRMSREEMLMHVITHGVGHRGQVSAIMLLNGITPARDGFTTWLHETEASARRRAVA